MSATLGAVLWVMPPGVHVPPAAPLPLDSSATVPAGAADPAVAEAIALANVFASSRTPPSSRFLPPELSGDSANGMMPEPPTMPGFPGAAMATDVPRLLGTVVGPAGTQALLQLDAAAPSPRLYGVGEGDGGYRVLSISPRTVVLRGPGGRVTLRLHTVDEEGR